MTRLRQVLAAAAALLAAGGITVGVALTQAGLDVGMSKEEWCTKVKLVSDDQAREHFFVAVAQGADVPTHAGGRVLGECADGHCVLAPSVAEHCAYSYDYDCGPLVNGWRVCDVYGHPYFARGWMLAAESDPDFRWYGSFKDVVQDCRAHFTASECLQILNADRSCWLLNDGSVCRYGRQLGTGEACPYANVQARLPCVVNRGAGSEMHDANKTWTVEDGELVVESAE